MLGIGIGEMVIIGAIALILIGPDKFPDFAKIVLRTVHDLRGYVDDVQKEVSKELKPLKRELNKISYESNQYIDKLTKDVSDDLTLETKSNTSVSKSQADPTDRQDDSFDYSGSQNYGHKDADPYKKQDDIENPQNKMTQNNGQDSSEEPEEKSTHEVVSGQDNEQESFSIPEPPVERLD